MSYHKLKNSSLIHMAIAAICFSAMGIVVKSLKGLPTHEIVFFRGLITLLYCAIFLKMKKVSPWGKNKKILLLRGLSGSFALYLFFHTLRVLPLSEATAIQKLSPFFVIFMAAFIGKRKIKFQRVCIFLLALYGVFQLKKVSFDAFSDSSSISNYILALTSSFLAGVAYTCINKLKDTEDPLVIMFYFPLITLTLMSPYTLSHWVMPTPRQWLLLILMGTIIQVAQYFVTLAYQKGDPEKIGPVYYIEIIMSCFWGYLFFAETLQGGQFFGIGLILLALILNKKFK